MDGSPDRLGRSDAGAWPAMPPPEANALAGRPLKEMMEDYERSLVTAALARSGGHQRRAAAALGILPSTLHEKMKRLGLKPRSLRPAPSAVGSQSFPR